MVGAVACCVCCGAEVEEESAVVLGLVVRSGIWKKERGTRLTSWFMSGAQIFGSLLLTQEGRFGRASWPWCKVQVLQSLEEAI